MRVVPPAPAAEGVGRQLPQPQPGLQGANDGPSRAVPHSCQHCIVSLINPRQRGLPAKVTKHPVGAPKAAKHHCTGGAGQGRRVRKADGSALEALAPVLAGPLGRHACSQAAFALPAHTAAAPARTCVDALAGEGAVAHAVQAGDGGTVEGHAEHAQGAPRGDGAIRAVRAVQELAVGARRAHLPAEQGSNSGKERGGKGGMNCTRPV